MVWYFIKLLIGEFFKLFCDVLLELLKVEKGVEVGVLFWKSCVIKINLVMGFVIGYLYIKEWVGKNVK